MIVIVDTNILSMFAKAQALEVLMELVGPEQLRMTPAVAPSLGRGEREAIAYWVVMQSG